MQWLFEGSDEAPDVAGLGAARGPLRAAAATAVEGPARRLELARDRRGRSRLLDGVAERHAGVLHALVRGARHADAAAAHDEHGAAFAAAVEQRPASSASSFIRRSRATPGCASCATSSGSRMADACCRNASSPASTSATAASSRASTSRSSRDAGDPAALARRYNARGHRRARHPRRHRDARRAARARGTIRAVSARAVHSADGRRRHPDRGRRRGGARRRRRQGQPQQRGAGRSGAADAPGRTLRQPGGRRRDRREARRRSLRRLRAQRHARPPDATPSSGRARPKSRGAGEILLTSIDRDGTRAGFDCALTAAVSTAVSIPVIASGGAGTFDHFLEVFTAGRADAALAASVFHYSEHAVVGPEAATCCRARTCPSRIVDPEHADSLHRSPGRPRSFSSCRASGSRSRPTDIDGVDRRFSRLRQGAADRSRRGEGRGRQRDARPQICARLPCRVGGGIRTLGRARGDCSRCGATQVIVGSALFRDGAVDVAFARAACRRGRARAPDCRRRQPRGPRRRRRLADDARSDAGRGHARCSSRSSASSSTRTSIARG